MKGIATIFKGSSISLILLAVVSIILIIDVTMVRALLSIGPRYSINISFFVFIALFVLFVIASFLIIRSIPFILGTSVSVLINKQRILVRYIPIISMLISTSLVIAIIFEMAINSRYQSSLLSWLIFTACIPSIIILLALVLKFISWGRNKKDHAMILYVLAISAIILNNILIAIYFHFQISSVGSERSISSIQTIITSTILPPENYIVWAMSITSSFSFLLTWIATALLLRNYSKKIGEFAYWILIALPLLYFIGEYQPIFNFIFSPIRDTDPSLYAKLFTMLFGLTRTVGGIFFATGFWVIARNIKSKEVQTYLRLSGFGILLIFVSTQISSLILVPYPPFGSIAISSMSLASLLTYLGVYSAAVSVSKDSKLRAEITKRIQEADLLGKIGWAQMEEDLVREVKPIMQRMSQTPEEPTISSDDDDIRLYVRQVLEEVKKHPN